MRQIGVIAIGGLGRSLHGVREMVSPKIQGLPLIERGLGVLAAIGVEERLILVSSKYLAKIEVPEGACAISFDDGDSPRDRLHGLAALGEGDDVVFLLISDGVAATPSTLRALLDALDEGAELAYLPASLDGRHPEGAPAAIALSGATLQHALRGWRHGSPGSLIDWAEASELRLAICGAAEDETISRSAQ